MHTLGLLSLGPHSGSRLSPTLGPGPGALCVNMKMLEGVTATHRASRPRAAAGRSQGAASANCTRDWERVWGLAFGAAWAEGNARGGAGVKIQLMMQGWTWMRFVRSSSVWADPQLSTWGKVLASKPTPPATSATPVQFTWKESEPGAVAVQGVRSGVSRICM